MCTMTLTTPSRKSRSCEMMTQRAGVALEPVLEPEDRVEVEVVGRLVEQQQVGRAHQRLREVQPHAPAAGKARHRVVHLLVREAEPMQQLFGARARRVRVGVRQLGVAALRCGGRRWRSPRRRARAPAGAAWCRRRSRIRAPGGRGPASPAPRARRASVRGNPTSPWSACSSPRSSANRLDLPEPLAPIRPILSPGLSETSALSSSTFVPRWSVTCDRRIMGAAFYA